MKKLLPWALVALLVGFIAYQNQVGHDPKVVSASPAKKHGKNTPQQTTSATADETAPQTKEILVAVITGELESQP